MLTLDDARALAAESSMVAVVSPGAASAAAVRVKSAYNAATASVSGIEPQYQDIRTIELEYGRQLHLARTRNRSRASRSSASTWPSSCSASATSSASRSR